MTKSLIVEQLEEQRDLFEIGKNHFIKGMELISQNKLFESGRYFQMAVEEFNSVTAEFGSLLLEWQRQVKI